MNHEAEMAAFRAESRASGRRHAQLLAKLQWRQARLQEKRLFEKTTLARFGMTTPDWLQTLWSVLPPPMSEMAFVSQITSLRRGRRDQAAAMLQGRHLSENAALALVWQLRHRNAGYRESALHALRGSTINSGFAGLALAVQKREHPEPELRQVAEQALRETNLTDGATRFVRENLR
jgi:hypothetical protein